MKEILTAALAIVLFAGCHTSPNSGRPGEEAYSESGRYTSAPQEPNDRGLENKPADNLRQRSPSGTIASPRW